MGTDKIGETVWKFEVSIKYDLNIRSLTLQM
jgi:hypothetical protein